MAKDLTQMATPKLIARATLALEELARRYAEPGHAAAPAAPAPKPVAAKRARVTEGPHLPKTDPEYLAKFLAMPSRPDTGTEVQFADRDTGAILKG